MEGYSEGTRRVSARRREDNPNRRITEYFMISIHSVHILNVTVYTVLDNSVLAGVYSRVN